MKKFIKYSYFHLLLVLFLFKTSSLFSCGSGHQNPNNHKEYVEDCLVYYDGSNVGYITEGKYKYLIISNDLLPGFRVMSQNQPSQAYALWSVLAGLGNKGAQYNMAYMLQKGIGVETDWIRSLDYAISAMDQKTHFNTANSFLVRVLQEALIGLGFLNGKPDGDFGPKTDKAVDLAIETIQSNYKAPEGDYWYFYYIVNAYLEKNSYQKSYDSNTKNVKSKPTEPFVTESIEVKVNESKRIDFSKTNRNKMSLPDLFQLRSKSVHMIYATSNLDNFQSLQNLSQGSAVAITKNIMITNCHVIEKLSYIVFIYEGSAYPAVRVAGDEKKDLCYIKSTRKNLYPVQSFKSSNNIKVGEEVYAIGSPNGLENTLSEGIVSGIREDNNITLIQTNAAISPGSSGGGLFDASGNLIGINTWYFEDAENIGFSVSIDEHFL